MKRKRLWVRCFLPLLIAILILGLVIAGCGPAAPGKESIKVGFGAPLTGIFAVSAEAIMNPYNLWAEQVNERGGIFVKDIGKSLPVELIYYDDKSTADNSVRNYERLITVDKVDLLLPPWGTLATWPLVPLVEKYQFPLVGATCGTEKFIGIDAEYFWMMPGGSLGHRMMPNLARLLSAYKPEISTVACLYAHLPIALEQEAYMRSSLEAEGLEIVLYKDYPMGVQDMSDVLIDIKRKDADAIIVLSEPESMILILKQSMEIGLDPKFYYFLLGPGLSAMPMIFGPAVEGITGMSASSRDGPGPTATKFHDDYVARFGIVPDTEDSYLQWAACEITEQAIEKAGTLDHEKLRDVIDSETFTTVFGPVNYGPDHINYEGIYEYGGIIQYQGGDLKLIWPPEYAYAEPIIPKPPWPK